MQLQYNNKSSEKQTCLLEEYFGESTFVYLHGLTTYQLCVLGKLIMYLYVENLKSIEKYQRMKKSLMEFRSWRSG